MTPDAGVNRPNLDELRYRLGTHGAFLKTMMARLSSDDYPALAGLTTRDPDDPAIALLDAWATVADVLTFYQERIANEGYLRTATEPRSILELARLVNDGDVLRPRPGRQRLSGLRAGSAARRASAPMVAHPEEHPRPDACPARANCRSHSRPPKSSGRAPSGTPSRHG